MQRPMTLEALIEAYLADRQIENVRDYLARGRPLAGLSAEMLQARWVAAVRANASCPDIFEAEASPDLCSEFALRGMELPEHLVTAEMALFTKRFEREARTRRIDPAAMERAEAALESFRERLARPKN